MRRMRTHYTYITILVFTIVCGFFIVKGNIDNQANNLQNKEWISHLKKDSYNFQQLNSIVLEQYSAEGYELKDTIRIMNTHGQYIFLKALLSGNPKWIIRFNDIGCTSCIQYFKDHVESFKRMISDIGFDNVIVILNTVDPHELYVFEKQYNLSCRTVGCELGKFSDVLETKESVITYYFCTVTKDMVLENCFINIQDWPERTEAYFECIKRKFHVEN